jgi:peptide-methionine (S)-S-oxide reductase
VNCHGGHNHQQYLRKNLGGYCNIGPNGMICPIDIAKADIN